MSLLEQLNSSLEVPTPADIARELDGFVPASRVSRKFGQQGGRRQGGQQGARGSNNAAPPTPPTGSGDGEWTAGGQQPLHLHLLGHTTPPLSTHDIAVKEYYAQRTAVGADDDDEHSAAVGSYRTDQFGARALWARREAERTKREFRLGQRVWVLWELRWQRANPGLPASQGGRVRFCDGVGIWCVPL